MATSSNSTRVSDGFVDLLISQGASVSQEDPPLHCAVREGNTDLALSLIKHGASVNQGDRLAELPWFHAMEVG